MQTSPEQIKMQCNIFKSEADLQLFLSGGYSIENRKINLVRFGYSTVLNQYATESKTYYTTTLYSPFLPTSISLLKIFRFFLLFIYRIKNVITKYKKYYLD